jgi:hypothetical protein
MRKSCNRKAPLGAASTNALIGRNVKPPVERVVRDFIVLNVVHKPVGFVYSSAPTPLIIVLVLQWLGFSYAIITVTVNS